MLHQACAHCGKFLAAASRRSRGRVSVPVWLIVLSDQLPITALVGHYPTNQLIGRSPLHLRACALSSPSSPMVNVCGISPGFPGLSPTGGQVSHVFLTRPPRSTPAGAPVRLACIRHAASVYPEPGSNSPSKCTLQRTGGHSFMFIDVCHATSGSTTPLTLSRYESRLSC